MTTTCTRPTYSQLSAYGRCVAGMLADPDCVGDLLLVGVWLARATILRQPEPDGSGWHLVDMARDLYPPCHVPAVTGLGVDREAWTGPDAWRVADVLKHDIRRYDVWSDHPEARRGGRCSAPMVRRETCGRRVVNWTLVTDITTGRRYPLSACGRAEHRAWWERETRILRAAASAAAASIPRPPANAGGVLARHIDLDWPRLWAGLDEHWTPPPEPTPVTGKPALTLILGDIRDPNPPTPRGRRAPFAVIAGGDR